MMMAQILPMVPESTALLSIPDAGKEPENRRTHHRAQTAGGSLQLYATDERRKPICFLICQNLEVLPMDVNTLWIVGPYDTLVKVAGSD
jgi:hypothetical protein